MYIAGMNLIKKFFRVSVNKLWVTISEGFFAMSIKKFGVTIFERFWVMFSKKSWAPVIFIGFIVLPVSHVIAQGKLDQKVSISIHQKPLSQALSEIGRKGNFYFSYNTNIIRGDSLVNVKEADRTVRQILDRLLGGDYEYVESGRYIIILQKATTQPVKTYTISGFVKDGDTREKLSNVTVYESDQLVSTLTDTSGFFRLKLREKYAVATIIISKQLYRDTLLFVQPGRDQQFSLTIGHAQVDELSPFTVTNRVEKSRWGRFFLSSRQVYQSMNLAGFFADKHIQFSLAPGLGTHGRMGAQVVNKYSFNIIGGYTAGVSVLEMAGIFNIDKKEVKYVQAAGIFNLAGGYVEGVQMAGIHNHDLDSVHGLQAGGVSNIVKGRFSGVQLAGLFNHVEQNLTGVQAAGIRNYEQDSVCGVQIAGLFNHAGPYVGGVQAAGLMNRVKGRTEGVQLAGLVNINQKEMDGLQASSLVNYTRRLKGVQIGLVNIADTSSGLMIGLVNLVKKGLHELTVSANEMLPVTLSFKTGRRRLYSILLAGYSGGTNSKAYSAGFGIGWDAPLFSKVDLVTEPTLQYFYLGDWNKMPVVYRFQTSLRVQAAKNLSFFAGPAFSMYSPNHLPSAAGYKTVLPGAGYNTFSMGNLVGWLGWTVGVNFF